MKAHITPLQDVANIYAGTPPAANPLVNEAGKHYVRYDEIRVREEPLGVINAEFYWRGALVVSFRVDGSFQVGQQLTLQHIEGRTEITHCGQDTPHIA